MNAVKTRRAVIVEVRTEGTRAMLLLSGELTLGTTEGLRKQISRLLQQGFNEIILDLKNVSYADSAGLGELVRVYLMAKNGGGRIRLQLANIPRRLSDLLVVTKLLVRFENDGSTELADPRDLDPLDPHLPRFGGNPARWVAVWIALVIVALVIATLAGLRGL